MSDAVVVTAGSALAEAAGRLRAAGVPEARREALALWAAVAHTDPGQVWGREDTPATGDVLARFEAAVARRASGAPQAYATGLAGFRLLDLLVDGRVLIPRPETEGLVELVLTWARARWPEGRWGSVLDVGTGSGCIALSLAGEGRFERIVATDVSADSLAVARTNAAHLALGDRIEWRQGSLLEPVRDDLFDIIVSNPPYLTTAEYAGLEVSVRAFEPRVALDGGPEGSWQTGALLSDGGRHLVRDGLVALEVDARRASAAAALARSAGWQDVRLERDWFDRQRYLLARKARS